MNSIHQDMNMNNPPIPNPQRIADWGRQVADHLEQQPIVERIMADNIELYFCTDFLQEKECNRLINIIDEGAQRSTVLQSDGSAESQHRTSSSCNLSSHDPFIKKVNHQIATLLGIPHPYGEDMQGQRYEPSQEFRDHHDYFFTSQPYWKNEIHNGGQRTWTAMVYLNEPEEGGGTDFPSINVEIPPRRSMLITWNNMLRTGEPNDFSRHAGRPVISGKKYIITKWFRENQWLSGER